MNSFRSAFVAPAVAVILAVATACGSVSPYAAKVDGESISEDALVGELRSIAANEDYLRLVEERQPVRGTGQGTFDSAFTAMALTRQIYYSLVRTELARRNLVVGESDLEAARSTVIAQLQSEEIFAKFPKSYQEDLIRRQAELDLLSLAVNELGPPEQAARAYYDANPNEFAQACASHILVAEEAKANELRQRIAAGEDFAALAMAESTDAATKAQGGDLGCGIDADSGFVPEFTLAVLTQPVGEVGEAVRTEFGYHLVKVTSRDLPPYEEVAAAARARVSDAGQEKVLILLQEAVQRAQIEVNPKYGTFRKTGSSPGVVPPESQSAIPEPEPLVPAPPAPAPETPSP